MTPINRRIGTFILTFVALSLTASVLPLLPGVTRYLPLEILARRSALSFYGHALIGFMLFVLPLVVRAPADRRSVRPWWWVGGFALAFSFIPLFVLAYIAGVHVRGALAILLWAVIAHGLVLNLLRWLRYGGRQWIVLGLATVTVILPILGVFREAAVGRPAFDLIPSPFPAVARIVEDFQEPSLGALVAAALVLHALTFVRRRRGSHSGLAAAAGLLGGLFALMAGSLPMGGAPPRAQSLAQAATAHALTGEWVVPGCPWPLRLEAARAGEAVTVAVAERETFEWTAAAGQGSAAWIYPAILDENERVEVRSGGAVERLEPRFLPPDRALVLGISHDGRPLDAGLAAAGERALVVWAKASELPEHMLAYRAASAVLLERAAFERLDEPVRRAILDHVRTGYELLLVGAGAAPKSEGLGQMLSFADPRTALRSAALRRRDLAPLDANLYSNFALPDWDMVDLGGLLAFLLVYHVVFYLTFLLPLLLDSKKGMGVYLVSVGFVLALVVSGAWYALKVIFLRDMQVLQQNIGVYRLAGGGDGPGEAYVLGHQITCFASFNEQPARLELDARTSPWPAYENRRQGAGSIRVSPGGGTFVLESVQLDRIRRKQVINFERVTRSPLRVVRTGDVLRLAPVEGVADEWGILTAKREVAFVRAQGRLYPVRIDGERLTLEHTPEPQSWTGVIPEWLQRRAGVPFVRYALGRDVPDTGAVLVILLSGVRSMHDDPRYLARRDIVQLLAVPLGDF
jgi:hypothetical protein